MTKLAVELAQEGYRVAFPAQVRADPVEGGPARRRREIAGARPRVAVQWFTDRAGYDYLSAFYRSIARGGRVPFTIDLIVETSEVAEYTAHFAPGSFELQAIRGDAYIVGAELEVSTVAVDSVYDEAVIMLYEAYGDEWGELILDLERLVNYDLPGAGW